MCMEMVRLRDAGRELAATELLCLCNEELLPFLSKTHSDSSKSKEM